MYEKRFDLKNTDYILQIEITGCKSELSEACVELSLDGVNWVTAARLPKADEKIAVEISGKVAEKIAVEIASETVNEGSAGNLTNTAIIVPIHAKAGFIRLVSENSPYGHDCGIRVRTGKPREFINGADVSHLMQLEDFGGRFYNRNGSVQDCLEILKDHGVDYIRLKVWNKPGLPDNDPAGYNDCRHVLEMAKRVKNLGLKLLIDFHYSDWWTDPGKQFMPHDWIDLSFDELDTALYEFTYKLICDLKEQGTMPEMVQVGNEITNGMLWDVAKVDGEFDTPEQWDKLCTLVKSGLSAVKAVDGLIRTIVHIERGGDNKRSVYFFERLKERGVHFDVIGLSYYSTWHGGMEGFRNNVNDLAERYGKDIIVVETAYPYTTENGDDTPNAAANPYCSLLPEFPATIRGQASNLHAVISVLKEAPDNRGIGCFYWQPDFIPVKGAGWKYGEGSEWDDQTMFDFNGHALWSLDVFKMHSL